MKYWIDDGTEKGAKFDDEQMALEYERTIKLQEQIFAEQARYLDLKDWPKDEKSAKRQRTIAENWLNDWARYDMRQNPGRYGREYESVETVSPPQPIPMAAIAEELK